MRNEIESILISEEEIMEKVQELGDLLGKEYDGKNPLLVGVLKGALPFMADLIKKNGYTPGNRLHGCIKLRK